MELSTRLYKRRRTRYHEGGYYPRWVADLVPLRYLAHITTGYTVVSGNRNSVRISFSNSFNGGLLTGKLLCDVLKHCFSECVRCALLVAADIYHMPAVCGTWPYVSHQHTTLGVLTFVCRAWWTNGPHWPTTGGECRLHVETCSLTQWRACVIEIDILEGVHLQERNQVSFVGRYGVEGLC